jgi:hypothetical protein
MFPICINKYLPLQIFASCFRQIFSFCLWGLIAPVRRLRQAIRASAWADSLSRLLLPCPSLSCSCFTQEGGCFARTVKSRLGCWPFISVTSPSWGIWWRCRPVVLTVVSFELVARVFSDPYGIHFNCFLFVIPPLPPFETAPDRDGLIWESVVYLSNDTSGREQGG